MKRVYVRVKTSQIVDDMTRYMAYQDVKETEQPQRMVWVASSKPVVHRFQKDGFTYFMRPSVFNNYWEKHAVERYASFGVSTETVRLEVDVPFSRLVAPAKDRHNGVR